MIMCAVCAVQVRLRGECELMVVTSRQHIIQEPTIDWLDRHFPEVNMRFSCRRFWRWWAFWEMWGMLQLRLRVPLCAYRLLDCARNMGQDWPEICLLNS
jgi:hypothetical protein